MRAYAVIEVQNLLEELDTIKKVKQIEPIANKLMKTIQWQLDTGGLTNEASLLIVDHVNLHINEKASELVHKKVDLQMIILEERGL